MQVARREILHFPTPSGPPEVIAAPAGLELEPANPDALPQRYRIRGRGRHRFLYCVEAPTLRFRVERGFSVSAAAARAYPSGSIFLDGAAQGEPFCDPERDVYNLDHHEGCVRAFTIACCEQAMVLMRKGLDLGRRDWTVYANDADLDTLLGIWVLTNHLRLMDEAAETRARVMPLLRLQGTIDALGLELQDLCAFPPGLLKRAHAQMKHVRAREIALKSSAEWDEMDLLCYTADQLHALDSLFYSAKEFEGFEEIEEIARAEIREGSIAVACRSSAGIYEVERQLRRIHGRRLGVIILQKNHSTYSLRQVDPSLPSTLEEVYARLNLVDPAAGGRRAVNRWGGSAEIGGSPRGTGTRASPEQIAEICQQTYCGPSRSERAQRVVRTVSTSSAVMLAALLTLLLPRILGEPLVTLGGVPIDPSTSFAAVLIALGGGWVLLAGRRAPGLYGLRAIDGLDWWKLCPLAIAGALAGGVWQPSRPPFASPDSIPWTAVILFPLGAELVFRGLVHGRLAACFRIQRAGGPWLWSWPTAISAALYALWLAIPGLSPGASTLVWGGLWSPALPIVGAFVFGLAAGTARERGESLLAPVLLHWLGAVAMLVALALG